MTLKRKAETDSKRLALTGQAFGRLTVMEDAGNDVQHNSIWLCRCQCGQRVVVQGRRLRNGNTTSCGCARSDAGTRVAARLKVAPQRRQEIALLGAAASKLVGKTNSVARKRAARKNGRLGGAPRSSAPRCNCGAMTATRAEARSHHC